MKAGAPESKSSAWGRFRSLPYGIQAGIWGLLGLFVGVAAVGGSENNASSPRLPSTTTSTTATLETTVAVDLSFVESEAERLCAEAAAAAVEQTPGVVEELSQENIDLLVESSVNSFGDRDFGDQETRSAALRGCRQGASDYLEDLAATTTTQPRGPVEVGRYSGSADTETDDFTVSGTWQLSWEVSGGAGVSVAVRTPDGRLIDDVSIDPGQSSSQFRQGCTCYLEISTFGSTYEIVVTDLP